jgi:hypothetical protein
MAFMNFSTIRLASSLENTKVAEEEKIQSQKLLLERSSKFLCNQILISSSETLVFSSELAKWVVKYFLS